MGPWGMARYVNSVVLSRSRAADPRGPEPACPLSSSCPVCLQSPAVVPTWRTTFLQVENGSLDSRKTKWISPDRAPRSRKTQMCLGGVALARQNTRPDTVTTIIRECQPTRLLEKENEAQPTAQATPRHATQEPSWIKASRQGHGSSARKPRRARSFAYPSGADSPCSPSGFQVKIPEIPEDGGDRGPSPPPKTNGANSSGSQAPPVPHIVNVPPRSARG